MPINSKYEVQRLRVNRMRCPKCHHEIENNKISPAFRLRLAGTHDTELEDRSVSCTYCGYKGTITSF